MGDQTSMLQAKTGEKKSVGCDLENVHKCVALRFEKRWHLMQCIASCDVNGNIDQKFKSDAFKKNAKLDVEDVFAAYCYQMDYVDGGQDSGVCLDQCKTVLARKPDCVGDLKLD